MLWLKHGKGAFALMMLATGTAGICEDAVDISSAVYVEHVDTRSGERRIRPADTLKAGDRVVTIMGWDTAASPRGFTLSSPVPPHLSFRGGDGGAQVSADGGRTWGRLGTLRRRGSIVSPSNVTHLRWRISGAQSAHGSVSYSAVVR